MRVVQAVVWQRKARDGWELAGGSLAPRDSKPWTTGRCVSALLRVLCVSLETRCVRHACALGGGLPSCLPDRILTESRTDAVVFKVLGGTQGAETGGRGHR